MNEFICFCKNIMSLGCNNATYVGLIALKQAQEPVKELQKEKQKRKKDIKISDLMRKSHQ